MTMVSAPTRPGEYVTRELPNQGSREQATLKSGNNLQAGAVLGCVLSGDASAGPLPGNTGNGTFVLDATTPILSRAKEGIYSLRCIAAATNGGTFRLEDPDGIFLGEFAITGGTVTVAEHIKGVLTDAGTDFAVGDGFIVVVSAITRKFAELAPAATDGRQIACALLYAGVDANSGEKRCVVHTGDMEANSALIVWPNGLSDAEQSIATAQLRRVGIRIR